MRMNVISAQKNRRKVRAAAAYLYPRFQGQEGVPGIAHLEDAAEAVLGKVPDLQDFQIRRDRSEVQLADEDVIDDDGRLRRLIERGGEHLLRAQVELGVCRQRRPVEVEGHREEADIRRWMSTVGWR